MDITACIITYNSEPYIEDCLRSIKAAGLGYSRISVIDNASQDRTVEILRDMFPEVTLEVLESNLGHSYACNVAINNAATEWVVLVDHDTVVHPDWLVGLAEAAHREPDAGIVVSRAIFFQDKETIHSDGGYAHFLGTMVLRHGFILQSEASKEMVEIGAAGTTSMVVSRKKAIDVGLFDSDFFIYLNDFEFSLRMRLAGYKVFSAPASVIYHKGGSSDVSFRGTGSYPARRAYFILRNRWMLIAKLYRGRTILLCLPALFFYEVILLLMSLKKRLAREYFFALCSALKYLPRILKKRKETQAFRTIGDRQMLSALKLTFVPGTVCGKAAEGLKSVFDLIFIIYWKVVRFIV